jgi:hypothetical protein
MSLAEKPSEASLPCDVDTIPVTTTTHSLPVNLSRQSSNIEKSIQNVYSMEVDNEVMNLSQKRYCEEDTDVTGKSCYQKVHIESCRGVLDTTLCDIVCQ